MPADDRMTIDERHKYLRQMQKRYRGANRPTREQLLDEMEHVTELHRKSLIRLMGGSLEREPRTQQRGRTYGPPVARAVQVIAESLDYPCAERLTPNLVWMARHLAAQGELQVTPEVVAQLGEMSLSTVHRLSADWPRDMPRRLPRGGPERARQALREVPGATGQGRTREECLANLREAIAFICRAGTRNCRMRREGPRSPTAARRQGTDSQEEAAGRSR